MPPSTVHLCFAAALLAASAALASAGARASAVDPEAHGRERDTVLARALYNRAHPDMQNRALGLRSLDAGLPRAAHAQFLRAARHADKPSQAMLGEMYWKGLGVPIDRSTAYAWMDLAAERHYLGFVVLREAYWEALDPDERARALEVGEALYAEYGDDVAKPRQEEAMRRARRAATGSRTGSVGTLEVRMAGPGGNWVEIDGSRFYADRYWNPAAYWAWQDEVWLAPSVEGRVEVGELEQVEAGEGGPPR